MKEEIKEINQTILNLRFEIIELEKRIDYLETDVEKLEIILHDEIEILDQKLTKRFSNWIDKLEDKINIL